MGHNTDDDFEVDLELIWRRAATTGTPMPTELDLAKSLKVSRPTIREALVRLEGQGLIARRAHQGTFANAAALSVPFRIDQSYELSKLLGDAGYQVKVDVINAGWSTVTDEEAADLGTSPKASCFRVLKRWRADGTPLIFAEDVVPARRRNDVELDSEYSVFETVQRLRGVPVEWEAATLRPVIADRTAQELLEVAPGHPLLIISVVGVSLHGERLYRGHETHRSGGPEYGMLRRSHRPS